MRSISICSSPQMPRPSESVIRYQMKEPGEFRWSRFAWTMRALIAFATVRWREIRVPLKWSRRRIIGFLQARKSGHAQSRSPFRTSVNKSGKENKSEVKGVDESESGGCPGEA